MTSRPALTREQSRQVDQLASERFLIPGIVLMENAGRGCAELIHSLKPQPQQVLVCCGPGNNGGDGYVIARHLDLLGITASVIRYCEEDRIQGDARVNYDILKRAGTKILDGTAPNSEAALRTALDQTDVVVDAMLGTGVTSAPREPIAGAIRQINDHNLIVVAIDTPSGLDCDCGTPNDPTIRAFITATMVSPKTGFLEPAAKPYVGQVQVIDIGTPRALLERAFGNLPGCDGKAS